MSQGTMYAITEDDRFCDHCDGVILGGGDYMLKDEVWAMIATPDEDLHIWCAVRRLGRVIRIEDLTDAPINEASRLLLLGRIVAALAYANKEKAWEHLKRPTEREDRE